MSIISVVYEWPGESFVRSWMFMGLVSGGMLAWKEREADGVD